MHHNNNHVNNNNTLSHQNNHQVNNGSNRFNNSNHHNNHHHQNNHYNNVVEPLQQQQQQQENGDNMPSRMNAPPSLPVSQRNNHNHQLQKDMSCGLISGGNGVSIREMFNPHSEHQLECIENNLLYQQTPSESSCTESSTDSSTEEEGWESGESDDYNLNENYNALPLNSFLILDDKNTSTTTSSTTYFSASIKHSNNNNNNDNDSNNINNKCSSSLEMTNNERVIGDEIIFNDMSSNHHQHHHDHAHSHLSYNSLNNVLTQQQQKSQQQNDHHQRQDNDMSLVPSTTTLLTNNYYQYQLNNKSNRKLFTKSNKKKYSKKRKVSVTGGDGLNVHDCTLIDLSLKITKKQKITVLPRQMSNDPQFRDAVIKNFKSNFNQTSPLPTPQQPSLSSSVDYYSSICDRQLSLGSPFKSPKELMQTFMASSTSFLRDGNVDVVNNGNKGQDESLIVVPKPIDSNDIGFNVEIRPKVLPGFEDAVVVVDSNTNNSNNSNNNNNNDNNNSKAAPETTKSSFYNRFSSIFKRNATNIIDTNQSVSTSKTQLSNELMSSSTPTRTQQTVAQRGNNVTHVTDFLANCISPTVPRSNRRNPFVFHEIRHEVQSINNINMNCVVDNKATDNVNNSKQNNP